MSEYNGWTLKVIKRKPLLCIGFICHTRKEVIKKVEKFMDWKKYRREGTHKIVKVKLVEVPNSNPPSRG